MPIYVTEFHHFVGMPQVNTHVVTDKGLAGVQILTSPAVLTATETLTAACIAEIAGELGAALSDTVLCRPVESPASVAAPRAPDAPIADVSGGIVQDAETRTTVNTLLAWLRRKFGLAA